MGLPMVRGRSKSRLFCNAQRSPIPEQQNAQMFRFPIGLTKAQATVLSQLITVKRLHFFLEIAMKTAWETVIVNG